MENASGPYSIHGTMYTQSIGTHIAWSWESYGASYTIPGDYKIFRATVGINDQAPTDQVIDFDIHVDGVLVKSITAGYSTPQEISVPVAGHTKVELTVRKVKGADDYSTYYIAIWAEARVEQ
jgi:NPCBM/NEW2 domain